MTLTIVADDLTGACDTGSLFAGRGSVPVTVWPDEPGPSAPVQVVDTESRGLAAAEARARVSRAARLAPAERYFKKIDSTLRGRIGAEVEGLVHATGGTTALVCPAFPAQGRTVVDRTLLVDGRPLAGVVDVLRTQVDRPVSWIPLTEVRAGAMALAARLTRLAGTVVIADAETDGDLDALVEAALACEPQPVLAGSAGLGGALARQLGLLVDRVELPDGGHWLIVVGSRNPASRRQATEARQATLRVVESPADAEADPERVARRVASEVVRRLEESRTDLIAVTGGETAVAVFRALDGERIDLVGPPRPGLALGRVRARRHDGVWLLTKAGGLGGPDLFVELAAEVAA